MLPGQLMFTGMDTGFLKKGVHMYKGVRGFALLIISHFLKNGGGVGGQGAPSGSAASSLLLLPVIGPRRGKTCLQGFQQSETQTSLLS